jgi:ribosomal protein S18 acetylase RimI-like enzyme
METILELCAAATEFQQSKAMVSWPHSEPQLIENEIREKRQWKMIVDNKIVCVWAITESDPQIWGEKNSAPALYLHRIATNPDFRGRNLVFDIVAWAKVVAKERNLQYIRMDTVGENQGLISHYKKCGFDFLGLSKLEDTVGLPAHYHKATVCLFQMPV